MSTTTDAFAFTDVAVTLFASSYSPSVGLLFYERFPVCRRNMAVEERKKKKKKERTKNKNVILQLRDI